MFSDELAQSGSLIPNADMIVILQQLTDGIILTDAGGCITFVNDAAKRMHGVSELGVPVEDYSSAYHLLTLEGEPYPPEELPLSRAVLKGEAVTDARWRVRRPDGSEIIAQGNSRPIQDSTGFRRGAMLTLRDVTAQAAAEQRAEAEAKGRELVQKALLTQQEHMRFVLEGALDAVIEMDFGGDVLYWNPQAAALFGWSREEALGRPLDELIIPHRNREAHRAGIAHFLQTGEGPVLNRRIELSALRRDGTEFPIELTATPVKRGDIVTFSAFLRDLTERNSSEQELRNSERRFRTMVEQSPYSIQVFALDGTTRMVNRAWEDLWGVTFDQIADYNILEDPQLADRGIDSFIRRGFAGEPTPIPLIRYDPNQTLPGRTKHEDAARWVEAFIYPVKDEAGTTREVILVHEDVTARWKAAEEIREKSEEVAALNERLKRSIRETHHRVKNNLQVISALAELQVEEGQETVPVSAIYRISQHTRALAALHDLLTLEAKSDPHIDSISSREAFGKLVPVLQATLGERIIRYEVDDFRLPVQATASLALLVSELISNAIKHGRGDIELSLATEEGQARLDVCDDGPGFPPGFNWQTAANTGLALIDSAGRFDLHGKISFENREEGGARVVVAFPVSALDRV